MIGRLCGEIVAIATGECLIDVSGVGYRVQAGSRTLSALPVGEQVVLSIETRMSESSISLFGFLSETERLWFVRLQSVPGVGARVALGLLDVLAPAELSDAIALGDAACVQRARGVGRKLAERIVAEFAEAPGLADVATEAAGGKNEVVTVRSAALSALLNLGYGRSEALRALASVAPQVGESREEGEWIREALKILSV